MRKLFTGFLGALARQMIRRFKPTVVAVTGSIGKTSTKEAIAAVLATRGTVRKSAGNLNNEIGVPLTIFGKERSAGLDPFFWFSVILGGLWKCIRGGAYPKFLVVEMGADHPGDIAYLTWITQPHISVVTAVSPVHMEFYHSLEDVAKEKFGVLAQLKDTDVAVLNADDTVVRGFSGRTHAPAVLFGYAPEATVRIISAAPAYGPPLPTQSRKAVLGSSIIFRAGSEEATVFIQGVLGEGIAMSIAAAAAVGHAMDIALAQCADALSKLRFPQGRMHILEGVDDVLLIDDTYNSSPHAVAAALHALATVDPSLMRPVRRYAILGHMAELGLQAEQLHEATGRAAAEEHLDGLIVLGEHAHAVARGAEDAGMTQERIFVARHHEEAVAHIRTLLEPGDIVLIKGSQAARMEAVTAALLANPELARDLLVRQTPVWEKTRPAIRLHITG